MDLIFASWIFAAAAQLAAGSHDWPLMTSRASAPGAITELHTVDPWLGEGAPVPVPPGRVRQLFCLERGVYTVEVRLGMLPTARGQVDGRLWLAEFSPLGAPAKTALLMEFSAEARVPTFQAGSIGVRAEGWTCYSLRYDATGPARVNPDPRITSFSIRR